MIERSENSSDSRVKLEEIRQKSDKAQERKALERRERAIAEERDKHAPSKVIIPAIFGTLATAFLVALFIMISNMDFDQRRLMISNSAFEDAIMRIKKNPNILDASFHQQLDSAQQIRVKLYIDYTVVDVRAKQIGSEVMTILTTPEGESDIAVDEVGSSRYSYQVVMSRLDDREVVTGVMAAGSKRVKWE